METGWIPITYIWFRLSCFNWRGTTEPHNFKECPFFLVNKPARGGANSVIILYKFLITCKLLIFFCKIPSHSVLSTALQEKQRNKSSSRWFISFPTILEGQRTWCCWWWRDFPVLAYHQHFISCCFKINNVRIMWQNIGSVST